MNMRTWPPAPERTCLLSIVLPLFNEEAVLPMLHQRLLAAVADVAGAVEIVYVDDGSSDGSPEILKRLRAGCSMVSVLRFSRNFGKEQAITAGLQIARGAAVIVMDSDLQHPPEMIPAMLQAWRDGADVVNMRRRSRADESWLKRQAARGFYRAINRLSDMPIPEDVGDFRLFSRRAVDALNQLQERNRFMKGLFAWIGYRQVTLDFDCGERAAGYSKWRFRQLWQFAIEGITAFSVAPLKVATKVGLTCALLSFALGLSFFVRALAFGDPVPGFPTLIVVVLMLGGLQMLAIGVLGEYIGRLSLESKRRPLFLIESYEPATAYVPLLQPVSER
ncbi:glycosyltransferase family 2 protein [Roseateles asaccharophilus]|uniref:Glycosyltransferase involved in cell wall biosynthesis n=1 Tax=Roseateles asaccharophilus TaxID=582607 RepID=A0ABU2A3Y7_9BURK|nr:glycosyltransferase family 2 protein [Roseateles asaccharophilus]MDR7331901.1 glycosyltransferase involved in cell wall biosynthesis [Roseateles asaccharophilus]